MNENRPAEAEVSKQAVEWVKANINDIFSSLVDESSFLEDDEPVATFMAGTPGAGKTEISKVLLSNFKNAPIRIDADEFRSKIPMYDGSNAYMLQVASTIAVQKVLDKAFGQDIPFLLDGTFAYANSAMNIKRALRHGYKVEIIFVYQEPTLAWEFTKAREISEGRVVPKNVFIDAYFNSRDNVQKVKEQFGDNIELTVVVKNNDATNETVYGDVTSIEDVLEKTYNREELERTLR